MKEIHQNLTTLCKLFNLGNLRGFETREGPIEGYNTAIFETDQNTNLKYHYTI